MCMVLQACSAAARASFGFLLLHNACSGVGSAPFAASVKFFFGAHMYCTILMSLDQYLMR